MRPGFVELQLSENGIKDVDGRQLGTSDFGHVSCHVWGSKTFDFFFEVLRFGFGSNKFGHLEGWSSIKSRVFEIRETGVSWTCFVSLFLNRCFGMNTDSLYVKTLQHARAMHCETFWGATKLP